MLLQEAGQKLVAKDTELAAEKKELARSRLENEKQRVLIQKMEEEVSAKAQELARMEADSARAATRRRTIVDNATRSLAEQAAQDNARLKEVKQVPARGP